MNCDTCPLIAWLDSQPQRAIYRSATAPVSAREFAAALWATACASLLSDP